MAATVRSVIDIGTNSVKLLVGRVEHGIVSPLFETSAQTRLGRGFYETHVLQEQPLKETAQAVGNFARQAAELDSEQIRVLATSAARDAKNPEALIAAVKASCGLGVEIISGELEAALVFAGAASAADFGDTPLLVVDIGGGSTELILGRSGKAICEQSFKIGSVRLMELLTPGHDPDENAWKRCRQWLEQNLEAGLRKSLEQKLTEFHAEHPKLLATGGTPAILARIHNGWDSFDRSRIEGAIIPLPDLKVHRQKLWRMPIELRRKVRGLPSDRADVILTGLAILESLMEALRLPKVQVSTRGLRFGALL